MTVSFDFSGVLHRLSTWLSGVSAVSIAAFAALPREIQAAFPPWSLLAIGVVAAVLVPVATSFKQKSRHDR